MIFFALGMYKIVTDCVINQETSKYSLAITQIALSILIYLQLNGKWIYAWYLHVDNNKIEWARPKFFGVTALQWEDVKEVVFTDTKIIFHLNLGSRKDFFLKI